MRHRSPRLTGVATLCGFVLALAGCQVGQRPTLASAPVDTDDANATAVLERLGATTRRSYTAEYTVRSALGDETTATVSVEGPRRTVTVGPTQYLMEGTAAQTCDTDRGECRTGIDAQPISRYGISPDFFGASAAARLARDAAIRVGPTTANEETIAGQTATCVTVPIEDTASVFCALDGGPLARWRSTDVTIELVAFDG